MGKRPAGVELFEGNMGSIQREIRSSMQREGTPTMETGLERIAAKARSEPKLRFTSLAHHITQERVWKNLCQIPKHSAPGVDGQTVTEAKESFREWVEPDAAVRSPQGIPGAGYPSRLHPQTRQTGKAPLGRSTVSATGHSSAARLRSCPPSTRRTSYHVRLAGGLAGEPITPWQPSMR